MAAYAPKKKRARKKKRELKKAKKPLLARKAKVGTARKKPVRAGRTRQSAKRKSTTTSQKARQRRATPRKRSVAKPKTSRKKSAPKRSVATKRPAIKRSGAGAKRPVSKRPASKRPASKRPASKRPASKRPASKRSAVENRRLAAKRRAAEKRAKEAAEAARREKRNKARRDIRAKRKAVEAKQEELRLQKEALRLKNPKTTRRKLEATRTELDKKIAAPPKAVSDLGNTFDRLFTIARQTQQLPKIDYTSTIIDSRQTEGRKKMVRIDSLVTEGTVEEILYKVGKAANGLTGYRIWLISTIASSLGDKSAGGSGQRVLNSNDPFAFKFQPEQYDSTGVYNTRNQMMARFETMLNEWADSEQRSLVYLHSVLVMHWTVTRS